MNNEVYKKVVEIFQTQDVLDKLQENSGGTAVFADKFSASDLQSYLQKIERKPRKSSDFVWGSSLVSRGGFLSL